MAESTTEDSRTWLRVLGIIIAIVLLLPILTMVFMMPMMGMMGWGVASVLAQASRYHRCGESA